MVRVRPAMSVLVGRYTLVTTFNRTEFKVCKAESCTSRTIEEMEAATVLCMWEDGGEGGEASNHFVSCDVAYLMLPPPEQSP